ncbi:MAG: hypothetical protein DME21_17735 [Verrucomicrobia bacterium]|nr:MAG: hypothetical protein DME21_17735 [Verrucomicrobiota bacterium]
MKKKLTAEEWWNDIVEYERTGSPHDRGNGQSPPSSPPRPPKRRCPPPQSRGSLISPMTITTGSSAAQSLNCRFASSANDASFQSIQLDQANRVNVLPTRAKGNQSVNGIIVARL